jgi:hypothetical protein
VYLLCCSYPFEIHDDALVLRKMLEHDTAQRFQGEQGGTAGAAVRTDGNAMVRGAAEYAKSGQPPASRIIICSVQMCADNRQLLCVCCVAEQLMDPSFNAAAMCIDGQMLTPEQQLQIMHQQQMAMAAAAAAAAGHY